MGEPTLAQLCVGQTEHKELNLVFLDPIKISEEGQYNLNNLKEISVTDAFMGLDKKTRNCQSIDKHHECNTMVYMENLKHECGCLPLALRVFEKVKLE